MQMDAEDVLTLLPETPSEVLEEVLPDFLPDLFTEYAEPASGPLRAAPADFGEEDVLSLADELPELRPLPPLKPMSPLRLTGPLAGFHSLPGFGGPGFGGSGQGSPGQGSPGQGSPEQGSLEYVGEVVDLPPGGLGADFALVPSGRVSPLGQVETAAPAEHLVETEKHVVFALAGAKYAVPMEQVLEVCEFEQFTPVMNVPDWIMGVTNLRGDIVSIVDLRHFLDQAGDAGARQQPIRNLVVAQTQQGDLTTCLAVESVLGLAHTPTAEIQNVERVFGDGLTPHTRGVYAQGNELLSMLDLESLLRALEITG